MPHRGCWRLDLPMLGTSTSSWGTQAVIVRVSGCTGVRNVPVRTQDSTSSTAVSPRRRTSPPTDPAMTVSFVTNRQGVFDAGAAWQAVAEGARLRQRDTRLPTPPNGCLMVTSLRNDHTATRKGRMFCPVCTLCLTLSVDRRDGVLAEEGAPSA